MPGRRRSRRRQERDAFESAACLLGAGDDVVALPLTIDSRLARRCFAASSASSATSSSPRKLAVRTGVLLIDALDVARGDGIQQALLDLIQACVATRRTGPSSPPSGCFDLRYNRRHPQLFPVEAPSQMTHTLITSSPHSTTSASLYLTDGELAQLATSRPTCTRSCRPRPTQMHRLVRTPLLTCACSRNCSTPTSPRLGCSRSPHSFELLERYWELRVLEPQNTGRLREALLRRVCELIVEQRSHARASRRDPSARRRAAPTLPDILSAAGPRRDHLRHRRRRPRRDRVRAPCAL